MSSSATARWTIADPGPLDRPRWQELYRAYGAVAGTELSAEHLDRVWSWITDPTIPVLCLLVRNGPAGHDGVADPSDTTAPAVGLAHYRPFPRPLDGSVGCYLDDLYVDESCRGQGAAKALLHHLADTADARGWSTVRWTTAVTNSAQHLYDSVAVRSPVITYNMPPGRRS